MSAPSDNLFRWLCLGVAVVFLAIAGWMINDIRVQVRRSAERLPEAVEKTRQTADVLSKHLPDVVDKTRQATDTLTEHLPEIVDRVDKTTEVVAELADDIKQLKELAGLGGTKRDENLVAYTNGVFKAIASSGGTVGAKKLVGSGLKSTQPAAKWVAGKRKWTTLMLLKFKSKKEVVTWLCKGWYIEFPNKEPMPLLQWLSEHHAETKGLGV